MHFRSTSLNSVFPCQHSDGRVKKHFVAPCRERVNLRRKNRKVPMQNTIEVEQEVKAVIRASTKGEKYTQVGTLGFVVKCVCSVRKCHS